MSFKKKQTQWEFRQGASRQTVNGTGALNTFKLNFKEKTDFNKAYLHMYTGSFFKTVIYLSLFLRNSSDHMNTQKNISSTIRTMP